MKNSVFSVKFSILKMKNGHFIFVLFLKVVQEVFEKKYYSIYNTIYFDSIASIFNCLFLFIFILLYAVFMYILPRLYNDKGSLDVL